jgi:hypothetical protein
MGAVGVGIFAGGLTLFGVLLYAQYLLEHWLLALAFSNVLGHEIVGAIFFVVLLLIFIWIDFLVGAIVFVGGIALALS